MKLLEQDALAVVFAPRHDQAGNLLRELTATYLRANVPVVVVMTHREIRFQNGAVLRVLVDDEPRRWLGLRPAWISNPGMYAADYFESRRVPTVPLRELLDPVPA